MFWKSATEPKTLARFIIDGSQYYNELMKGENIDQCLADAEALDTRVFVLVSSPEDNESGVECGEYGCVCVCVCVCVMGGWVGG